MSSENMIIKNNKEPKGSQSLRSGDGEFYLAKDVTNFGLEVARITHY